MSVLFLLILLLTAIFCIVLYYLLTRREIKHIDSPQVSFPSLSQIHQVIDTSAFFQRMNKVDLVARNATTVPGYIKLYKAALMEFPQSQKTALNTLTQKVDAHIEWTKKLNTIPWKFAKVATRIEEGWPHTLGDIIFLSDEFFKMSQDQQVITLLHEKFHVYQRLYPLETHKLIAKYWGFTVLDTLSRLPIARNNPDINGFVYGVARIRIFQAYNSLTPSGIPDSRVVALNDQDEEVPYPMDLPSVIGQREHPYEIMACFLPEIIIKKYGKDPSPFTSATNVWMSKFL